MREGYRLRVTDSVPGPSARHYSGSIARDKPARCTCPNCEREMFPVFTLDFTDERLSDLDLWPKSELTLYFCPWCALYMKPYFVSWDGSQPKVTGGERDGGELLNPYVETPYFARSVIIEEIAGDASPRIAHMRQQYLNRRAEVGIYHQIGGHPIRGPECTLRCDQCAELMVFAGIVDYDDQNVPLYEEPHRPLALIIGDWDCLNVYVCMACEVVGFVWAR